MNIFRMFGFGSKRLMAEGSTVSGIVTGIKPFRWLKINMSLSRTEAGGSAAYPHIVFYEYEVDGKRYSGSRYADIFVRCPRAGDPIKVFYDKSAPGKSTVKI